MKRPSLRAVGLAALGVLSVAAPASADWTTFGGNVDRTFYSTEKLQAPLGVVWKHATSVVAERSGNKGGPVISEGVAYFPSKNRIYAVDAASGELKWRAPEGDPNDTKIATISATPTVNGEYVFVPDSSGTLTAYTVDEGAPAWQFKTGGSIRSSPILVGNSLYFGSDDDYVYSINAQSGDLLWKSNERGKSFMLSDDPNSSPCYYNGVLYVNSSDMKLWAFQADTGRLIWQSRIGSPAADISPVANNGRVYLAAGSTMYQFRLRGGQFRAFPLQEWVANDITTTPIITEKFWFFGDRDGNFHAFNSTGKPATNAAGQPWKVKLEGQPKGTPVMTKDTIYVTTDKGFVYGIDMVKGEVTWTYRTEAPKGITPLYLFYAIRAPLAASDGKLFVLGDDGTLTALSTDANDDEGPMITTPRPSRGAVMNGNPPLTVGAYMWDEGSGINPETVELLLDGRPIDVDKEPYNARGTLKREGWTYDPVRRFLRYTTPKAEKGEREEPLINGRHKVQIQAADWRGNFNSLEWTFVVDNSLPRNAVAVKPKSATPGAAGGYPGAAGAEGGYPGGGGGGYPGGGPGMGGPGAQNQQFRGRNGAYTYGNRGGRNGYQFGQQGGQFGGQQGRFGGRGGMQGRFGR